MDPAEREVQMRPGTRFVRPAAIALCLAMALPAPGQAYNRNEQLYSAVSQEMPFYVRDADISGLTNTQLARIYTIMHSRDSHSEKVYHIRSILGGRNSLRGILFGKD